MTSSRFWKRAKIAVVFCLWKCGAPPLAISTPRNRESSPGVTGSRTFAKCKEVHPFTLDAALVLFSRLEIISVKVYPNLFRPFATSALREKIAAPDMDQLGCRVCDGRLRYHGAQMGKVLEAHQTSALRGGLGEKPI